jgi:hypothetical protein
MDVLAGGQITNSKSLVQRVLRTLPSNFKLKIIVHALTQLVTMMMWFCMMGWVDDKWIATRKL